MSCDMNYYDSSLRSPQTCQPFLEDSFSCQPPRPTGRKSGGAPFHTAGVENADRSLSVYPNRSDNPQRGQISQPGDRSRRGHMIGSRHENALRPKGRGIKASCDSLVAD